MRSIAISCLAALGVIACSSKDGGGNPKADAGGPGSECASDTSGDPLVLAAHAHLGAHTSTSACVRWTANEDVDISGVLGSLGQGGHHMLVLMYPVAPEPDGTGPCSESTLMDPRYVGRFSILGGASPKTDGMHFAFPADPVQIGAQLPRGAQIVLEASFVNSSDAAFDACAKVSLDRGAMLVARIEARTVLPSGEYTLAIPAHQHADVAYDEVAGDAFRIAAATSEMLPGGTHFKMTIKETGQLIYVTTDWASPTPVAFASDKIVIQPSESFHLECSFDNEGDSDQHFPDQMCIGAIYLVSCSLPGAC